MGNELIQQSGNTAISSVRPTDVLEQMQSIQQLMSTAMQENQHFGKIPGCGDKPTLLKAGAEKLNVMFRLAPEYIIEKTNLPDEHREYGVVCTLRKIDSGQSWGQGVGSCSTRESKYRYRTGPVEFTDKPVPREYWDMRKDNPMGAVDLLGGKGFVTKKNESGVWMIAKQGGQVENTNPADQYNTVLKMAKKRALVDATLTATAASDIFTQDLEEIIENEKALHGLPVETTATVVETKPAPVAADTGRPIPATSASSTCPPASQPMAEPGEPVIKGIVQTVEEKSFTDKKTNAPKPYWLVTLDNGEKAATFSDTTGPDIAKSIGCAVEIPYKKSPKGGKNFDSFAIVRNTEPDGQPADGMPF